MDYVLKSTFETALGLALGLIGVGVMSSMQWNLLCKEQRKNFIVWFSLAWAFIAIGAFLQILAIWPSLLEFLKLLVK